MRLDYKDAVAAIEQLRRGDARGVEPALVFLRDDVYAHRSGYLKERAWHYLRRVELTATQKRRLLQVALWYVRRRMAREFAYMARTAATLADDAFYGEVLNLAGSPDASVRRRATALLAHLESRAARGVGAVGQSS